MKDNDFIRLVREKNIGEEFYSFLDEHDINYVIDLLLRTKFDKEIFNYIVNYYNERISIENTVRLIRNNKLSINDLLNYMYSDNKYVSAVIDSNLISSDKYKFEFINKAYIAGGLKPQNLEKLFRFYSINSTLNEGLLSDVEYTKVLANNCENGYYFKSAGINVEVVDILLKSNIRYDKKYDDCDLYKNFYFIISFLKKSNNILSYINSHYNNYDEDEILQILNIIITRFKNDNFFVFINHDARLINTWLDNDPGNFLSVNIDKISDEIIKDENNGVVLKFIDKGLFFNNNLNPIIRNSEKYVNYKLNKDIADNKGLNWIQYIGNNLIDNPSNGIINKAIENGCYFYDIFFEYTSYINKYIEKNKIDVQFFNRIPNSIIDDPNNNVVINIISKDLYFFLINTKLYNIKEYLIYFIENLNEKVKYSLKKVVDNCDINIIIDNNLFEKCVKLGYIIDENTPKQILDNKDYIYFYIEYTKVNYNINNTFKLLSNDIINDVSNGIVLNSIRNGYSYSKDIDIRILEKKEYVLELLNFQEINTNINMLNSLPESLLNDRDIVYQCIENGYRYDDNTPKELYQIDYIKKYFEYYNETNPLWITANKMFKKIDVNLLNNSSNGLIYSAIDYGYEINNNSPYFIYNNIDYLLYFIRKKGDFGYFVMNLFIENKKLLNNSKFIYSLIDYGYKLSPFTPIEITSNYNYVMYALKSGKVSKSINIPFDIIDEDIYMLLVINKIYEPLKTLKNSDLKIVLKENITLEEIPKEYLNDKNNIINIICYIPNVIDIIDDNILDSFLIRAAFINNYKINDKQLLTKYINIIGLKELIKINPYIIEYYNENEFKELFNQNYEEIIRHAINNGYNIASIVSNLPNNLNNKIFIKIAIEYNFVDIINYIDFDIDFELFEIIWFRKVNIKNDRLKNIIINKDEFINLILNSNTNKLIKSIELFYPNNFNNSNLDILIDKIIVGYTISDKEQFKHNLFYLRNKNKEIFYDLNLKLLTDKYMFLGIETINRILADKEMTNKVLKLNECELKLFSLCISYLYSIDLGINVNDILYKILNNLNSYKFSSLSKSIVNNFVNLDALIDRINDGKTNGEHIFYLDNLINILCIHNNIYKIDNMEDVNKLLDKKKEYFSKLVIDDRIDTIKNIILYKFYNIDLKEARFIYDRYCYLMSDIQNISDINLRKILYDIIFLIECNDKESLINIYDNITIEEVDLKYSVLIESLIRNEYVKQFNGKFNNNKLKKLDDNIYELEDSINLLVHVLGGYNSRYTEPLNFMDEWNIELMTNHGVCTSYITNQNLSTARNVRYPTLVFTDLEDNSILLSSPDDIGSNGMNVKFATSLEQPCCFLSPDTMIDETRWHHNEVVLERKYLDKKSEINYKRLPNYVLYMVEKEFINDDDSINIEKIKSTELWRMTEKASKDFGVSILIINKVKINKKERQVIEKMKQEMISTKNYLLINKIIVRYMNNLMDDKNIITKDELEEFVNYVISMSYNVENGIEILKILYQTILDENRKFAVHRTEEKYNYLKKFESIVKEKIIEMSSDYSDNIIIKK